MTSVEIWYDAPDTQIIDLDDEQEALWRAWQDLEETDSSKIADPEERKQLYRDRYTAEDEFMESISHELDYDLGINDISEW